MIVAVTKFRSKDVVLKIVSKVTKKKSSGDNIFKASNLKKPSIKISQFKVIVTARNAK